MTPNSLRDLLLHRQKLLLSITCLVRKHIYGIIFSNISDKAFYLQQQVDILRRVMYWCQECM